MPTDEAHDICDRVEEALERDVPGASVTIHIEPDCKVERTGVPVLP